MKTKKKDGVVTIDGTEYQVPDAVADAFAALSKDEEKDEKPSDEKPADEKPADQEEEEEIVEEKEEGKGDAMQAQIDSLKAQLDAERDGASTKIDARVTLVTNAKTILGDEAKTDGVKDVDLMRQIVASVTPSMKAKADKGSADYVRAAYEMALEQHGTKVDSTEDLLTLTHDAVATDKVDLDSLYTKHLDALSTRSSAEETN